MIPYHFICALFNTIFDFDLSVANDVVKCTLPWKVMQGSPCLELHFLTNENV